jgi:hypothetical protein
MKVQDVLPVILSILVIILVAVFQRQSKLLAAITATMPLAIPLALWIVHASVDGDAEQVSQFTLGLLLSIFPTVFFIAILYIAARAGFKLLPMILLGYGGWGMGVLIITGLRKVFGY